MFKSPLSSPILPNKFTLSEKGASPCSSNSRKMKYKHKDEQQHELMFMRMHHTQGHVIQQKCCLA